MGLSNDRLASIVRRLEMSRLQRMRRDRPSPESLAYYHRLRGDMNAAMLMPHRRQYDSMLELLSPGDVVLDAGAGDLRFSLMMSQHVERVYAVEFSPETVWRALRIIGYDLPTNLQVTCAHWDDYPVPDDVTVIIVLVNISPVYFPREWFLSGAVVYHGDTWNDEIHEIVLREGATRPVERPVRPSGRGVAHVQG